MATPRDVKERLRELRDQKSQTYHAWLDADASDEAADKAALRDHTLTRDRYHAELERALSSLLSDSESLGKVDARLLEEIEKYESKIVGAQSDYMNITVLNVLKGIRAVLDAPSSEVGR